MADKFAWRSKSLPQINIDVFSRTNVCVLWFLLLFSPLQASKQLHWQISSMLNTEAVCTMDFAQTFDRFLKLKSLIILMSKKADISWDRSCYPIICQH